MVYLTNELSMFLNLQRFENLVCALLKINFLSRFF